MKEKAKPFRTSQDVYNQIRHDPRLEPARYVIGFETRFDGMKEIRFEHFQPGTEIPWHRIWYFRTESQTVWDRRTRLDRVSSHDEANNQPLIAQSVVSEDQESKPMKGKDLMEIGLQPGPVLGVALRVLPKAVKRLGEEGAKGALRAVLADPEAHLDHEYFADVAAKIVELNRKPVFTERETPAPYRVYGEGLENGAIEQMVNAASLPVAVRGALMPDAHMGYGLPIGGVLATDNAVIPYAVGVDIACRMKLSILDVPVSALEDRSAWLEQALERETRFGTGGSFERPNQHDVLDMDWNVTRITASVFDKAVKQLGTSGSGNHFVEYGVIELTQPDLGLEPGKYLALMSHSGSRGAGATVANHYSRLAMDLHPELPDRLKRLAWLDLEGEAGQEYWAAMNLMGEYAKGNHAVIHRRIAKALGANVLSSIENHHNFAWREIHDGRELIVHRKGATPAGQGVLGVIPGSMAAPAFVVRGRGEPASLESASHGAGRAMSRTKAKEQFNWKMIQPQLEAAGVKLLSAGIDENPFAYKDINAVMAAQSDLVDIVARFSPRIVKMANEGEQPED